MADRYWVGGSASWDATAGTKWSLTSGGAGGEAVPTSADDVYIDSGSGAVTVTVSAAATCKNLSFTSGAGDFAGTFAGTSTLAISGSLTLSSGMTRTYTGAITFNSTGSETITTNGKALNSTTVTFDGVGGQWSLQDNADFGTWTIILTNGTLNLNSKSLLCGALSSSNANIRTIAFGTNGSITCYRSSSGSSTIWTTSTITNFTTTGTGKTVNISYSGAVASTIATGGLSEANSINFNITAGTYALTCVNNFANLNFTGFSGSLVSNARTIYGSLTFSSGMTITAGANATSFTSAIASEKTITTNGITVDMPLSFSGAPSSWRLTDNLTMAASRTLTLTSGTLNIDGKTLTVGSYASSGSGAKVITFGTSGTITVLDSGATAWSATGSNLTTNGTSATINMTSASAKTFAGGGFNYAATLNQGGSGALTISGSNTFSNITNTTQPVTITFTAGTTQTVSSFTASGTSGNLVTLQSSSAGSRFTLSDSSGANTVSHCSIKDSIATGGAYWQALPSDGNVDAGNNLGWIFSAIPVIYSQTSGVRLRSLAQRGRF